VEEEDDDDGGKFGRNGSPRRSEIGRRCLRSRWGSRIYVHLTVVVGMRIVDWGVRGLERNVIKLIDARNGSGMSSLAMRGHNGCILFAVLSQF